MNIINKPIDPNTELHRNILNACVRRRDASVKEMRKKYPDWHTAEELHNIYVHEREADRIKRQKRRKGVQDYVQINVGMSYAITMSMHTYLSSVFLSRDPIMQFSGRHGESEMAVQAMEALHAYQLQVGRQTPVLYSWLLDKLKYGVGFMGNYWAVEKSVVSRFEMQPKSYYGIPIPGAKRRALITEEAVDYKGNRSFNIRPFDMRIDPRVSLQCAQEGEFMGRKFRLNWSDLIAGEADGRYFNVSTVKTRRMQNLRSDDNKTVGLQYPELNSSAESGWLQREDLGTFNAEELVVKIQPSEWGLGKNTYPEKWVFTWVEDEVIIGCRPLGCYHNKFPYPVLEYEMDHSLLFKRGAHDIIAPMHNTMNWLVNTHFYNVRSVLNDSLVVDPSRLIMSDLRKGGPGRVLRLKRTAWGTNPAEAVHQLRVGDVTNQHLNDTRIINELAHKLVGVNDNIMGTVHPGGRKTATEVRSSAGFGINRMKTATEYDSVAGWFDFADMLVSNTLQYYDDEQTFKIVGDMTGDLKKMQITPDDIRGQYDFVPVDGTLPIDRFAQATLFKELLTAAATNEAIGSGFDLSKLFAYTARIAGAKNINQFRVNIVPDEQILNDKQSGNAVAPGTDNAGGAESGTSSIARLVGAG